MPSKYLPPLLYIYKHRQTTNATGYFACEPQDLSVQMAFEYLQEQPLDTFLHKWVLNNVLKMPVEDLADLAEDLAELPVFKALMQEAAFFFPSLEKAAKDLLPKQKKIYFGSATPLPDFIKNNDLEKNFSVWNEAFFDKPAAHEKIWHHLKEFSDYYDSGKQDLSVKLNIFAEQHKNFIDAPEEIKIDSKETAEKAAIILKQARLDEYPEMRHEASLAPIALLRQWNFEVNVQNGRIKHRLKGINTSYGRGFSLAQCRASLRMEIIERASAYASVIPGGKWKDGQIEGRKNSISLKKASINQFEQKGVLFYLPYKPDNFLEWCNVPFYWVQGECCAGKIFVPCQAVFLFCNLDEPALFDAAGSAGLGTGNTVAEAKLSALVEIIERDSSAVAPFCREKCFIPASRDKTMQALLNDYRFCRIYPVIQDITSEIGLPAYRSYVAGMDGNIAMGQAAGFNGKQAALSALSETPWPYKYSSSASFDAPSCVPENLPVCYLEDLPDFELPSAEAKLKLLENVLKQHNFQPLYIDISKADLGFPVFRAFVNGLDIFADFDALHRPSERLVKNWINTIKIKTGE